MGAPKTKKETKMRELWMKPYETTNEPDWMDEEPERPEINTDEIESNIASCPFGLKMGY